MAKTKTPQKATSGHAAPKTSKKSPKKSPKQARRQQICSADKCTATRSLPNPFVRIPGTKPTDWEKANNIENESFKEAELTKLEAKDRCRREQLQVLYSDKHGLSHKLEEIKRAVDNGTRLEVCQAHYKPEDLYHDGQGCHLRLAAIPLPIGHEKAVINKKRQLEASNLTGVSPRSKRRRSLESVRAGRDESAERLAQLERCEERLATTMEECDIFVRNCKPSLRNSKITNQCMSKYQNNSRV